jgi:hypothetical protein
MLGLALNDNNDIFSRNGRIAIVENIDEVAQHIKTRLLLFLGEWFLDVEAGTPWFQEVFVKPVDISEVEAILKNRILQTPGVNELTKFNFTYESPTRIFSVTFSCTTIFGDLENQEITSDV